MTHEKLEELFKRYKAGNATAEDKAFLEAWYLDFNKSVWYEITDEERTSDLDLTWSAIQRSTKQAKKIRLWPRIIAAATVLIAVSFGVYFYIDYANNHSSQNANFISQNDIGPGGNKASLTLADGRKIILTDAENGELARQSGIKIIKAADGQLIYTVADSGKPSQLPLYNTIETPVGGQYQVNLPDGSKVWLNSASSLRYPVRFTGKERKVEITGEAYFEIARDKSAPFRVTSTYQTVEVLGTHFNIMAYPDEISTNTTLVEGSVKVIKENQSKIISPGQQTRVKGGSIDVIAADINEATAWKNGYFVFKNEDIQSIMRKISRWYNVEVEYQSTVSEVFGGKISRSRNVSEVLEILESTGLIHFRIIPGDSVTKERRIIVMP